MKKITIQKLIDLHLDYEAGVPSNRESLWEILGKWQIENLLNLGLTEDNTLLDVGCGPLRLGMYAIPFLKEDRYCGVDIWPPYKNLGQAIMQEIGCQKQYSMLIDENFSFSKFNKKFNYSIAQSVITHLSVDQINQLFTNLKSVMKENGKFLFTYSNNAYPYGIFYEMEYPMIAPGGLSNQYFKNLAQQYDITYDGAPNLMESHPTGQNIAIFKF